VKLHILHFQHIGQYYSDRADEMTITRRQAGDRRWGLPAEFPLEDSAGLLVPVDRRRLQTRRRNNVTMEQLRILLSGLLEKNTRQ
jgi:hypothetical protein